MRMPPWAGRTARTVRAGRTARAVRTVRVARVVAGERAARIYLGVVAVCLLLTLLQTAIAGGPALSFSGVLLELATLPWTPALWRLFAAVGGLDVSSAASGWTGWTLTVVAAIVAAALDAVLIGYGVRAARRRVAAR
ncbi:SCO4225 family membrane protein [Streptomyces sp. NPDC087270]|uniref:SCO4225 family membrane protein n=1 Tax=Streptomyces sp. NPDC087270 TaxID=3365774 RepID=UPI00381B3086